MVKKQTQTYPHSGQVNYLTLKRKKIVHSTTWMNPESKLCGAKGEF